MIDWKKKSPLIASTLFSGLLIFVTYSIFYQLKVCSKIANEASLIHDQMQKISTIEKSSSALFRVSKKLKDYQPVSLKEILNHVKSFKTISDKSLWSNTELISQYTRILYGCSSFYSESEVDNYCGTFYEIKSELQRSINMFSSLYQKMSQEKNKNNILQHTSKLIDYIDHVANKPAFNFQYLIKESQNNITSLNDLFQKTQNKDVLNALNSLINAFKNLFRWAEENNSDPNSDQIDLYWKIYETSFQNSGEVVSKELLILDHHYQTKLSKHKQILTHMKSILPIYFGSLLLLFAIVFYLQYRLNVEAIARTKESQNLVQVLCHDVANPITVIITGLEFYQMKRASGKEISDRVKNMVVKAILAAKHIQTMIQTVRLLKSMEAGKITLDLKKVSLTAVFDEVISLFEISTNNKNISIRKFIGTNGDEDLFISTHKSIFTNQILANLISNAIKFSEKDSNIDLIAKSTDNKILIEVRDYGIGMPKSLLDKIFSDTEKTSRAGTNGETGTGFGMPLVKKFIEMHKGASIKVTSIEKNEFTKDQESGTTITLIFNK